MSTVRKDKSKVFEMVLSSPGMSESCKLGFKISRQNILVLARVIESSILETKEQAEDEILGVLPEQCLAEFRLIHEELLKKSGLTEFYEKLKSF